MKINFLKSHLALLIFIGAFGFQPAAGQIVPRTVAFIKAADPKFYGEALRNEANADRPNSFLNILNHQLAGLNPNLTVEKFCSPNHIVTRRILKEYGAVFVGKGKLAALCLFGDEARLSETQKSLKFLTREIGGVKIELQPAAMEALLKAVEEAENQGLSITPLDGSIAARRSYSDTVSLWKSRVNPGLNYWVKKGKLTTDEARRISEMPVPEQVAAVLELEGRGIFFSRDFSKSILYSVSAPGASQHNLMLAFDVTEHAGPEVRRILAKHGWFQTVVSDLPHFTYLGVTENELPKLGLKKILSGSRVFWTPSL